MNDTVSSAPVPNGAESRGATATRSLVPFMLVAVALVGVPLEQWAGGGDRPRDILTVGLAATAGALGSVVYTRLERDPRRAARVRLGAWTIIRFFLVFEFMRYGTAKLVGMQFYRRYYFLDSRVIDLTPMNLAWAFFGQSYGYQAVGGAMEIAGALLLCFRRTTTLGGCVLLAVMSNVVLVNFSYGVPVKLFACTYLVMILYLLGREGRRFWAFFISDGPVPPREYLALPARRRTKQLVAARGLALAFVLGVPTWDIVGEAFKHRLFTEEPILGAWNVDRRTGLEDASPETSGTWDKIYFEKGGYGFIRVGKKRVRFDMNVDEVGHVLRLSLDDHEARPVEGRFDLRGHALHIEGDHDGRPFSVDLTRDFPR
jgi:uncharacterized membrane protein YphA (DoxX/SURF4 family)